MRSESSSLRKRRYGALLARALSSPVALLGAVSAACGSPSPAASEGGGSGAPVEVETAESQPSDERAPDVVAEQELVGLRRAARAAGKLIGAAVEAPALRDDATYGEVLAREFDYVTPEDAAKWGALSPAAGAYAWDDLDSIVDFAERQSQKIKGHTLIWHQQLPAWVNEAMTAEQLRAALESHIELTLTRYRGRVRAWDVVNEAVDVSTESGYTDSIFWRKLGPSYIEDAFRRARAVDPDVLLFYNEVGIERMGPKSDFTYTLMRELLERGVPIDGIGLQSHVSTHRYPAESDLRANIRRFAELGLRVNISEADVRTLLMPGDQASRWQAQRVAFQQIVGACVVEPGCEGVTLWGFSDAYTWINDDGSADDPLIFDRTYAPKPAYDGVLVGLSGVLPELGENLVANGDFALDEESWSAPGAVLAVADAIDRNGRAACVSERTGGEGDALAQTGLVDRLSMGGPFSFSAWVRLRGAPSDTVNATLLLQEAAPQPRALSLATVGATDAGWVQLAGYFGLGFEGAVTAITLELHGPAAGVELCVADVRVQALTAP